MATLPPVRFQLFRYQILPVLQVFQSDWLKPGLRSMDDLLAKKNVFFTKALADIKAFEFSRTEVSHVVLLADGRHTVLRIGARRTLDRERKDFTHEAIDSWPSLLVICDHEDQKLFIEKNTPAFQSPQTVATMIQNNINPNLILDHLQCTIDPMFERADFWEMVRKYEGKIECADFELVSPNMPGMSKNLTVDLKTINQHTNSFKTNLRFQSPDDSALSLKEDDPLIQGLVTYASDGGGNITLKAKRIKKVFSTRKTTKEITIEGIEITGKSAAQILAALKGLL